MGSATPHEIPMIPVPRVSPEGSVRPEVGFPDGVRAVFDPVRDGWDEPRERGFSPGTGAG
ncbi:hypothetical protein EV191_109207 [Tamaricihabitans halophyticus]|uniref:Uncharacterized protein n=1 Tax=Tamaricihabitans halophyticus TaxID=1262583 RepID=A0A4R2QQT1_9PSEU|nr:hypothetical protein [Tamaricihabitans halophyticus]TCP49385.1 hypothetical protein EV191_109207 [Tamaricihabitans halophyticus]